MVDLEWQDIDSHCTSRKGYSQFDCGHFKVFINEVTCELVFEGWVILDGQCKGCGLQSGAKHTFVVQ